MTSVRATGAYVPSVSQFTTMNLDLQEEIAVLKDLGLPGLDIAERMLSPDPGQAAQEIETVYAAGLVVTGFVPRVHAVFPDSLSPELADPNDRADSFAQSLRFAAAVLADPKPPILSITGAALDGDYADSWQRLRTTYRRHATLAGDLGLEVAFEPLGPTFMNTDTTVCTWRGALDLAQDVDHDSFRLAFDTWHVWDEPDIWSQLRDSIDRVASVHVSDFPAHGPRAFGDRLVPGDGVVSFPDLGRELRRAEYAGPVVLEIFSDERLPDSLWLQPAQEVVGRSWTYLHEVLGAPLVS